jgi:serine/threonine protein kinase
VAALKPEDPRFIGDYQLLGRLGTGGMGRVFLGRSPGGRKVAVKVLHGDLVHQPEFRSRFRREIQAARLVSGAFTAPVIDADPDAAHPWLVTGYIGGPSLQQAVAGQGPLPAATVLSLAAGLAEALVSIHDANLVHRDLKPSNVLLAEDGPRVIDFGIARAVETSPLTKTGFVMGSPGFMSPEQVNTGEVTQASDVFSLGAVLAYAATGTNPFGQGPSPALLYRVVHADPDLGAVTDPTLRTLIADCLAKTPDQRPTPREILARVGFGGGRYTPFGANDWLPATGRSRISEQATALPDTVSPGIAVGPDPQADTAYPHPPYTPVRRGPARRALMLSALATVAVVGVPAGLYLTRDTAHSSTTGPETGSPPFPSRSASSPAPVPVGAWPLDKHSGSSVADTIGTHNGTASRVRWGAGNGEAAEFNGVSSQITIHGPVLNTAPGHSFTVSAWVYFSNTPKFFATAISQDATVNSSFYLQYSGADHRWAFSRPGARALSSTAPATDTWTHLVGVRDAPSHQLRLYVDGNLQGTATDTSTGTAMGSLIIGRARSNGQRADFFLGGIKDVQVFDQALSPAQIKARR